MWVGWGGIESIPTAPISAYQWGTCRVCYALSVHGAGVCVLQWLISDTKKWGGRGYTAPWNIPPVHIAYAIV